MPISDDKKSYEVDFDLPLTKEEWDVMMFAAIQVSAMQLVRKLTQRAPDARKSAPKNRSKNKKGSAKPARG